MKIVRTAVVTATLLIAAGGCLAPAPRATHASSANSRTGAGEAPAFAWPLKGRLLSRFSPQTAGVEIAGVYGATVEAAADGQVAFIGDDPHGAERVVMLRHKDGYLTVYGGLGQVATAMNAHVAQGAALGRLGAGYGRYTPRLRFEVRARRGAGLAEPTDPLELLPRP